MAGIRKLLTCDMGAMGSAKVHDFDAKLMITQPDLAVVSLWSESLPVTNPIQQQAYAEHLHH